MIEEEEIQALTTAILRIAEGDANRPSGLESVAIALAGEGLNSPIGTTLQEIADSIRDLADAIRGLQP